MKKKVLYRLQRDLLDENGKKVASKGLEIHFVDPSKDFHHSEGIVKKELLLENGRKKDGKESIVVHDSEFSDLFKQIKRKAQIITSKDLGAIISNAGLNRNSVVLDAGVGSGSASCFLGSIVKEVHAFDVNEENIEVARDNKSSLKLENVHIKKGDVYDADFFVSQNYSDFFDAFILDVPDPANALSTANVVLKKGGWLVIYCPSINQIQKAIIALPETFLHSKTIEIIEREWSVSERVLRPVTKDFGHTAFIAFVRKIY